MRKLKIGLSLLLAAIMLIGMVGAGWGAATLDDVSKDVQELRSEIIGIREYIKFVDWKATLMLSLFGVLTAFVAGMTWTIVGISKEVRMPKAEEVSKLKESVEKMRDYLVQVSEKLHLPKPLL